MNRQSFYLTIMVIIIMIFLSSCSTSLDKGDYKIESEKQVNPNILIHAPFEGWVDGLPKIEAPEGFNWRQFEGVKLNMISENTPPSAALAAQIDKFEEVTGINVNIEHKDLPTIIEKVGLDFNARSGDYQIIYADPFQILVKYPENFVDLNRFNRDPTLPHIPGGVEDFIRNQLDVVGYIENRDKLLALPYDAPTMLLAYRKDIFHKYKEEFFAENGYDWTPGPDFTWQQYYEIGKWINEKIEEGKITEVKYGIGHQAERHDSLMNDFSNILAANGGDYLVRQNLNLLGTTKPGKSAMTTDIAIESAEFYLRLLNIADPESTSYDWYEVAEAFAVARFAMSPQWHEYSSIFENKDESKIAGNVGWTILPKGKVRHANAFGGTGIGINRFATDQEQKAAWLFLIWATSPQLQYMILQSDSGGSTPTRYSVYQLPDVKKGMKYGTPESKQMPNLMPMAATFEAWKNENIYMRPKIPQWQQVDTFIFTELSKMIAGKQSPKETATEIAKKSNKATAND
ncbi:extracellular solute-binding protein [Bacillus sp. JJ1521]|uniref:extracellular solute-binding protein n=1 Tax=Bacillus sp. JJ1521 TaxID=3122957 RepID=UPI002FFDEEDD